MKSLRLGLAFLTVSALSACSHSPNNLLLESQTRCPQTLQPGQTLTLSLPSNPSTGYRWELINAAPEVLRSLSPEVFHSANDEHVVGAPGHSVWRFAAYSSGQANLELIYKQPWNSEIAEHFQCAILVR